MDSAAALSRHIHAGVDAYAGLSRTVVSFIAGSEVLAGSLIDQGTAS